MEASSERKIGSKSGIASRDSSRGRALGAAPKMKGIGFANVKSYVENRQPKGMWQRVLDSIDPEKASEIDTSIAVGWYEVALFATLLRAVDEVCGNGDLALMREIGAYEADQDMNRVLRIFLRVLSPSHIFTAEAHLWRHFQDTGAWSWTKVPGGVDATLAGWVIDDALLEELAGYLARMLEFTGGRHVTVRYRIPSLEGVRGCAFEYRWK